MKTGNLNFLEPSGLLQACNGTALPLPVSTYYNCLTEDEPADSKHLYVKYIAKIKMKFSLTKVQFDSLHYMIILQCTLQNNLKLFVLFHHIGFQSAYAKYLNEL